MSRRRRRPRAFMVALALALLVGWAPTAVAWATDGVGQ